jgi:anti-sigma regulatory factor (Ser/Thr protein kinase)
VAAPTTIRGSTHDAGTSARAGRNGMDAMDDLPPARESGVGGAAQADGTIQTELAAERTSARQARGAIRQRFAAWQMERPVGDAELLASELPANAAEHGHGKPIGLVLSSYTEPDGRPGTACEVTDSPPDMPRRMEPSPDAERGRGLAIVAAPTCSSGVRADQADKTSWFTLALTDRAHRVARQIEHEHEPETGA